MFFSPILRASQRLFTVAGGVNFSPQAAEHIAALPAIPPRPETRRTPWLSPLELETYLYPLTALCPWKVRLRHYTPERCIYIPRERDSMLGNGLVLSGSYCFTDKRAASNFIKEVKYIAEQEGSIYTLQKCQEIRDITKATKQPNILAKERYHLVNIKTLTPKAFIPQSILDLRPSSTKKLFPAKDVTPFPNILTIPGLTMRDIRFSLFVDQLFRDEFRARSGLNSFVKNVAPKPDYLDEVFRFNFCECCGLPHALRYCPQRVSYEYPLPPRPKIKRVRHKYKLFAQ
ncbi:hypothetical protein BDP27DRAFT_1315274 [Rhodocollybia butyracea]|uniref:Uncharacterized protein n=1 Tax=Rhodocollybia butyracea TaxID=206335 RepID=A0A9P5Q6M0_9AGAR|nr:hypothetical protein BDP27DRAFT_1315274 [Rhodocollybia butyracea]